MVHNKQQIKISSLWTSGANLMLGLRCRLPEIVSRTRYYRESEGKPGADAAGGPDADEDDDG